MTKSKASEHPGANLTGAEPGKQLKIGTVEAGCAGMFTAMILDEIKERITGFRDVISYDILEAAGEEKLSDRLYTHEFSETPRGYYDVGAMWFPATMWWRGKALPLVCS